MTDAKIDSVIKDYLSKLDTLKKALIDERKKNENYSQKIKEYESQIAQKENDYSDSLGEKSQLQNQLHFEESKKKFKTQGVTIYDKIFHKEKFSKEKLEFLHKENNEYKKTNLDLNLRILENKELYDQNKVKYQSKVTIQTNKLNELKEKMKVISAEITEMKYNREKELKKNISYFNLRESYEREYEKYCGKIKVSQSLIDEQKKNLEISKLKEIDADKKIKGLNDDLSKLALKLGETKTMMNDKDIKYNEFKVNKKGDIFKKLVTIGFGKNKKSGKFEMVIIKVKGKKVIPFGNIIKFEIDQKDKCLINLEYYYGEKRIHKKYPFISHYQITPVILEEYRKINNAYIKSEAMI